MRYTYKGRPRRVEIIVSDGDVLELSAPKNRLGTGFTEVAQDGGDESGNSEQGAQEMRSATLRAKRGSTKE